MTREIRPWLRWPGGYRPILFASRGFATTLGTEVEDGSGNVLRARGDYSTLAARSLLATRHYHAVAEGHLGP